MYKDLQKKMENKCQQTRNVHRLNLLSDSIQIQVKFLIEYDFYIFYHKKNPFNQAFNIVLTRE